MRSMRAPASAGVAGVLAVNVAPGRGIFMGETAVVSLNGEGVDRMAVKPSVAMRMALQGLGSRNRRKGQGEPGGVYPTRLIEVLAYIRQTLFDAHYYNDALETSCGSVSTQAVDRDDVGPSAGPRRPLNPSNILYTV